MADPGAADSKWSFRIGELFGITLRMHATFGLLVGWIVLSTLGRTGSLVAVLASLVLVGAIFSLVVMHEYGHALAARHFGIGTREITLLPIGGVARLERMPEDPRQEMLVALAGPAVNLALAIAIALLMMMLGTDLQTLANGGLFGGSLLAILLRVNVIMAVFNMLPALPMDGGRVLRAALALRMPALRATRIASGVARSIAGGMMLLGFIGGNWLLALVGLFVWMGSRAEYGQALWSEMRKQAYAQSGESFWTAFRGQDPAGEWVAGPNDPATATGPPRVRVEVLPADEQGRGRGIRIIRVAPDEAP